MNLREKDSNARVLFHVQEGGFLPAHCFLPTNNQNEIEISDLFIIFLYSNVLPNSYDNWHLPTEEELFSVSCIFFWKKNNDCVMNRRGEYWIVSQKHESSLGHGEIDFSSGPEYTYIKAIQPKGHVRAVRP